MSKPQTEETLNDRSFEEIVDCFKRIYKYGKPEKVYSIVISFTDGSKTKYYQNGKGKYTTVINY